MDLALFVTQLNRIVQGSAGGDDILAGVCDLLRMHIHSSVRLECGQGRVLVELLPEDDSFSPGAADLFVRRFATDEPLVALILSRNAAFGDAEVVAAGMVQCICTLLMRQQEGDNAAEKKRRVQAVRAIINTLSFSELEAASHIIKALGGSEGLLVAGHIADKLGVARSVVTAALRKLEGTGLIETRSLGMKGTYIRIMDQLLAEELGKL